jgi:hypothetical protein
MNLLRRLEALEKEKKFDRESIILHMPDGRSEALPGNNDYALDLFTCATRGERTPELELICAKHQVYGTRRRTHDRSGAGLIERAQDDSRRTRRGSA